MDGRHFDDLARALAGGASRRNVLKGLAGGAGGALSGLVGLRRVFGGEDEPDEQGPVRQACGALGVSCLRDDACCSGFCDLESDTCACTEEQVECDGECADLDSDPNHCGECGEACLAGQRCLDGACCAAAAGPCQDEEGCCGGLTCCDGRCSDPSGDPNNCGDCGTVCPFDPYHCEAPTCQDGTCGSRPVPDGTLCIPNDPSYACCDGGCADLHREDHCGECGNACADGETCCRGEGCFDLETDAAHCGGCFHACDQGESCVNGQCCPGPGTTCDADDDCCGGDLCCDGRCIATRTDPRNCGGCGESCPPGQTCTNGNCGTTGGAGGTGGGPTGGGSSGGGGTPPTGQGAPIGGSCGGGVTCGTGAGCCEGTCTNFSSNPAHCGGCNRPCATGQTCSNGVCTGGSTGGGGDTQLGCGSGPACGPGKGCCDGTCVTLTTDSTNCGGCGVACGGGETCCNGGCVGTNSCPPDAPLDLTTCACRCADGRPTCGTTCCGENEGCNQGTCTPYEGGGDCDDDDGCDNGYSCCDGTCVDPDVDRRHCGACGYLCPEGKECCDGVCVSLLTAGHCGACGFTCPTGACCRNGVCTCPGGQLPCDGECPDYGRDPNHCGACGQMCDDDEECRHGECQPTGDDCDEDDDCPDGYDCCDGSCYDLETDPTHCGDCEGVCLYEPATCLVPICEHGECGTMPAPDGGECHEDDPYYRCCGGYCVNLYDDPHHCGCCGYACDHGYTCCAAEGCYDLQTDPYHCGHCDNACEMGETCVGGTCWPTGDTGTHCETDEGCADGLTCCPPGPQGVCRDLTSDEEHCGECGQACTNANPPCQGVRSTQGTAGTWSETERPACAPDETYFLCCDSSCADVLHDPLNCGDCGLACAEGQECVGGYCTGTCETDDECGADQRCCGGECVDPLTDPRYCGDCETACAEGELCCEGGCTTADEFDCGACGYTCHEDYPTCEPYPDSPSGYHCCTDPGVACDPSILYPCCGDSACVAVSPHYYACCLPEGEGCESACGLDQLCPPCCSGYCNADGVCATNPDLCDDGRPLCDDLCCESGWSCCEGTCYDTQTDPAYCGACDNACPEEMACEDGRCCHFEGQACLAANSAFDCCAGYVCDSGTCIPFTAECEIHDDCDEGWGCCEGVCYDFNSNPNHCGECDFVCETGTTCLDGTCQPFECVPDDETCPESCTVGEPCDACCGGYCGGDSTCYPCEPGGTCEIDDDCCEGLSCCNGTCVDLANDPTYCGDCETVCPESDDPFQCQRAVCRVGVCQYDVAEEGMFCVEGDETFACCGGTCTDLYNEPTHCGVCGQTCDEGWSCCDGACYDTMNDPQYCGDCGTTCPDGMNCYAGVCCHLEGETCGAQNEGFLCCPGYICEEGACVPATDTCDDEPVSCAGEDEEGDCTVYQACLEGICRRYCTGAPDSCCPNEQCWDVAYEAATDHDFDIGRPAAFCFPSCETDDDCGPDAVCCPGYCGSTPDGEGQPGLCNVCVDTRTNPLHCGQCGTFCESGQCVDGLCETETCLPPGETCETFEECCPGEISGQAGCEGTCCVSLLDSCESDDHCCGGELACPEGSCCLIEDVACDNDDECCPGLSCQEGESGEAATCRPTETTCEIDDDCDTGWLCCDLTCVDPATDPRYCGACDNPCPDGTTCVDGVCETLDCLPPGSEATDDIQECCPGDVTGAYGTAGDLCCVQQGDSCSADDHCCNQDWFCEEGRCCGGEGAGCHRPDDVCCLGYTCDPDSQICVPDTGGESCEIDDDCGTDQFCCNELCVDPLTDPVHCGACGATCPEQMSCEEGGCCHPEGQTCGAANLGFECCAGYACVEDVCQPEDGVTDPCALVLCGPDSICCGGECYDPMTDPTHCGGCDTACPDGVACTDGACEGEQTCSPPGGDCSADSDICCPGDISGAYGCEDDVCCVYGGDACTSGNHEECCGDLILCEEDRCCAVTGAECAGDDDCCPGHFCDGEFCQPEDGVDPCAAVTCPTGNICCDGECYDPMTELEHCGECGNACADGERCTEGACAPMDAGCAIDDDCADDWLCCDGACVDPNADPNHCGACYGRCFAGECQNPVCQNGLCGTEAAFEGETCDGYGCTPDGACQGGVCSGEFAPNGTVCYDGNPCRLPGNCFEGACSQDYLPDGTTCETDNPCLLDGVCGNGYCYGAYAPAETSCEGGCYEDASCRYGACVGETAASDGTQCDDGNPCTQNDTCRGGVCRGEPVVCEGGGEECQGGVCDPSQGGCVTGTAPNSTPCAGDTSFCCGGLCCDSTYAYDACAGEQCCYAESASPDGQICCDIGDPASGQGIGEYWVEGFGCCRVILACGNQCCPHDPAGGVDQYCHQGACRDVNQPCANGCAAEDAFGYGPEVCINDACCPGWRACGDVCCEAHQHCENGACADGYPRQVRTGGG